MTFINEHLIPGVTGHILIYIALLTAACSAIIYFYNSYREDKLLTIKTANTFFNFHVSSLIGAALVMYYILFNHYYEYKIAWQYTSNDMPARYIFSCLWASEDGSFITWALLQAFVGILLLQTISSTWKASVMGVFSLSQFMLTTLIAGIHIFGFTIGSNPFSLLREATENLQSTFFQNAQYMNFINDGNGMNPMLKNFWMISHPPFLFLGYSLTLVPFAFAVSGFMKKKYSEWLQPAFPWMIAALLILGTGIILGAAWAYESLPFGGFWSWDPIENASLLPWLLLIASIHIFFVAKKTGSYIRETYILSVLPYLLVLYASFLTKSGILADTSVHAFTDNGKFAHLLFFLFLFLIISFFYLFKNKKSTFKENTVFRYDRSLMLLIGVIVILFSAFQIFFITSIPVINKIFNLNLASPADKNEYFIKWQTPFMALIILFISIAQYFKYGTNTLTNILKLIIPFIISFIVFAGVYYFLPQNISWIILTSIFFLLFSIAASIDHYLKRLNKRAALVHFGFSVFLLGIVISFSCKTTISENIRLTKNISTSMDNYLVTYKNKAVQDNKIFFNINFQPVKSTNSYILSPFVSFSSRFGTLYEPAIKHLPQKDIFAFLTYADISDINHEKENYKEFEIGLKDTIIFQNNKIILDTILVDKGLQTSDNSISKLKLTAEISIINNNGKKNISTIDYIIRNDSVYRKETEIKDFGLKLIFNNISQKPQHIIIGLKNCEQDFIVIKATTYPFINLIWIGILTLIVGLIISIMGQTKRKNL